jgi:three-Cys-motif partner protein
VIWGMATRGRRRNKKSNKDQPVLLELPKRVGFQEPLIPRLSQALWSGNKARLIARYLYYFIQITRHGTYIDGFAGPQRPDEPNSWSAKLVLDIEPKWLRRFYLFEKNSRKVQMLRSLKDSQPEAISGEPKRLIRVYPGDFNVNLSQLLESSEIGEKEATFCLLDQRTFECEWSSVKALAQYHKARYKNELFYFLMYGWEERAMKALGDVSVLQRWWGRDDWEEARSFNRDQLLKAFVERFRDELAYASVVPWQIYKRRGGRGGVLYHMIHATDHPEGPKLMSRAYEDAVRPVPVEQQLDLFREHSKD